MRQLEAAFALDDGIGERAFLVTEEFAFDQVLRHGGAVELDEGRVGARALAVERAGHQFLAGAALALDEHGGLRARHLANEQAQILHHRAVAQQFVAALVILRMAQELVHLHQLAVFLGLLERDGQMLRGKRLGQEGERAVAHALDRHVHRAVARNHHHQRLGRAGIHLLEQVDAVAIGQAHIDDHQIEVIVGQQRLRFGQSARAAHFVAAVAQLGFEGFANDQVVLQHNDFFNRHKLISFSCVQYYWEYFS